jgi:mono/diheme cytochrome c family protein
MEGEFMVLRITILFLLFSTLCFAEKNKSEMQELPSYLKGMEVDGKKIRHGYIRWLEKRPFTPMIDQKLSEKGEKIYIKHCLQCHGPDGKGNGPVAKKYGVKAANLYNASKTLTNHTLFIQVTEGRGDMPQWMDVLNEEEIWALTHYIASFK